MNRIEEYQVRQLYYMENSQENALQVAFEKARKEIKVQMHGIYVLSVLEGSPSEGDISTRGSYYKN